MMNPCIAGQNRRLGILFFGWALALPWIGAPALSQQWTVRDIMQLPQPPADHRIPYGEHPLQFGDLRLPKGQGPFPVAVFIHGGCWSSQYTLDHTASLNAQLAKEGIASWSLEYRRVGDEGGGWPGTFQDVSAGTDQLRDLAHQYPLDLNRVVLMGHSAGGHLALWLAARRNLPAQSVLAKNHPLEVKGVLALAAVPDLEKAFEGRVCGSIIESLMGGTPPELPERYRQASPRQLLPTGIPQLLVNGDQDSIVPLQSARDYLAAALAAGDNVELVVLQDAGHFEMIAPTSPQWKRVLGALRQLLQP